MRHRKLRASATNPKNHSAAAQIIRGQTAELMVRSWQLLQHSEDVRLHAIQLRAQLRTTVSGW